MTRQKHSPNADKTNRRQIINTDAEIYFQILRGRTPQALACCWSLPHVRHSNPKDYGLFHGTSVQSDIIATTMIRQNDRQSLPCMVRNYKYHQEREAELETI